MKKYYIKSTLLLATLLITITANAQWIQIGADIDGEAADDNSGRSVSMSSDGSIVAIGAYKNDGNGDFAGHVRIYQNNSGTWTQIGSDIDGESAGDWSGYSVSLSADGTVVAIGAYRNDSWTGHVRIYKNISGTWTQLGADIDGEAEGDFSGVSVSLSSNGNIIAIGALTNDDNGENSGHVRIYENNSNNWTQIGNDINGEAAGDFFGHSVSLSTDGSVVAIGAYNENIVVDPGYVRIYKNISGTWTQLGSDIDGEAEGDFSGTSVSLSSNGNIVAIGAPTNDGNGDDSGHVRVYENNSNNWTQLGNDIDGEAAGDQFGFSVSLSDDGLVLAIGATLNDGHGSDAGHVRIYNYISNDWVQIGNDIDSEAADDNSGRSVSLSADGSMVAIGAIYNDGSADNAGHVRVYNNPNAGVNVLNNNILVNIYPNPATEIITIEGKKMENVKVMDITGKLIYNIAFDNDFIKVNLSSLSKGIYLIHIRTKSARVVRKIVLE